MNRGKLEVYHKNSTKNEQNKDFFKKNKDFSKKRLTKKIEGIKCASLAKRKKFFKNKTRQSVWALDYKMTLKEKNQ